MKKSEKLTREVRLVTDTVKDMIAKNLVLASRSGTITINESDLSKVINVLNLSVEDAYQASSRTYQKTAQKIIEEK